jgi:peroxiredoxin
MPKGLAILLTNAGFVPADALRPSLPFEVRDAGNAKHSLDKFCGKTVLLAFWGVDCPHCLKRFSALEQLVTQYRNRGLIVLPICADETDPAQATTVARRHVQNLTVFADPSAMMPRRFDVQVLPTTVLIDTQGRLLGRAEGVIDWSSSAVADLLNEILEPGASSR